LTGDRDEARSDEGAGTPSTPRPQPHTPPAASDSAAPEADSSAAGDAQALAAMRTPTPAPASSDAAASGPEESQSQSQLSPLPGGRGSWVGGSPSVPAAVAVGHELERLRRQVARLLEKRASRSGTPVMASTGGGASPTRQSQRQREGDDGGETIESLRAALAAKDALILEWVEVIEAVDAHQQSLDEQVARLTEERDKLVEALRQVSAQARLAGTRVQALGKECEGLRASLANANARAAGGSGSGPRNGSPRARSGSPLRKDVTLQLELDRVRRENDELRRKLAQRQDHMRRLRELSSPRR